MEFLEQWSGAARARPSRQHGLMHSVGIEAWLFATWATHTRLSWRSRAANSPEHAQPYSLQAASIAVYCTDARIAPQRTMDLTEIDRRTHGMSFCLNAFAQLSRYRAETLQVGRGRSGTGRERVKNFEGAPGSMHIIF